jgi:hypothetical protein
VIDAREWLDDDEFVGGLHSLPWEGRVTERICREASWPLVTIP